MKLNAIPLVTALLPALAAHLCYLVAAYHGHVSWCFPYFPDCVSISATGRHGPESVIFRAALIPAAILMMIYWRLSRDWLRVLGTRMVRRNRIMVWFGMAAALRSACSTRRARPPPSSIPCLRCTLRATAAPEAASTARAAPTVCRPRSSRSLRPA